MSSEKYLQDLRPDGSKSSDFEELTVENVLREFPTDQLRDLTLLQKMDFHVPSRTKKDREKEREFLIAEIARVCRERGIKGMILEFTRRVMDILVENLDRVYLTSNGENNLNLTVKRKRCYEKMIELSVKSYLQEYVPDAKDLIVIVEHFDREPWGNKSEALIEQICEIFDNGCLMTLLAPMPVKFLKVVCKRMRIEYPKGQISSRVLADFIIFGTHSVEEVSEEEKPLDLSPKCPDRISDKCSRSDLIHYFTVTDLQNFLTEHELISTGKKVQLVNRILDYYVDKEETFNRFNPEKRREKKRVLTEKKEKPRLGESKERKKRDWKERLKEKRKCPKILMKILMTKRVRVMGKISLMMNHLSKIL